MELPHFELEASMRLHILQSNGKPKIRKNHQIQYFCFMIHEHLNGISMKCSEYYYVHAYVAVDFVDLVVLD